MASEQILSNRPSFGSKLNASHPLAKGLVGCWLCNDTGQRVMDSSPYGKHGSLVGNPTRNYQGFNINGAANRYINYWDNFDMGLKSLSIAVCISTISASDCIILGKSLLGVQQGRYYIGIIGGNIELVGQFEPVANVFARIPASKYIDGKPHLIVAVFDRTSNEYLYVDGTVIAYTTISPYSAVNMQTTDYYFLGAYQDGTGQAYGGYPFTGKIAYNFIWDRVLSAQEIKQLYLNPYDMFFNYNTFANASPLYVPSSPARLNRIIPTQRSLA